MIDRASDLRAIADGRLLLNVRNGVTVSRSMLARIADEFEAMSTALAAKDAELAEVRQQYVDANEARIDAEAALAEARKALEPFALVAEAQGWRDMASAPRDGSMVLVASSRVYPAVHPARWRGTDADASSFQYWDAWQHWFQDDDLLGWQPLPTPPVNQIEGADRG